jgi:hypothetical protein
MDGSTLLMALIYETASQPGKTRRFFTVGPFSDVALIA